MFNSNSAPPSEIFFIWLGGPLPKKYLVTLLKLATFARVSNFKLTLWVDHVSNYYKSIDKYMSELNLSVQNAFIQIKDLNELKQAMLSDEFFLEKNDPTEINKDRKMGAFTRSSDRFSDLWQSVDREMIGANNLAAASDILRYIILYLKGGYYFDTDTKFKFDQKDNHTFEPELLLLGFKANIRCSYSVSNYKGEQTVTLNSINGGNDIMASLPRHPIIREVIKKVIRFYTQGDIGTFGNKTMMDCKRYTEKVEHLKTLRSQLTIALSGPGLLADTILAVLEKKSLNQKQIDSICTRGSKFSRQISFFNMNIEVSTTDMTWIKNHNSEKAFDDTTLLPKRCNFFL